MKRCLFCGAKAEILCDTWLGWERKRGEIKKDAPNLLTMPAWGVPIRYRLRHTCDAPLCRACAVPNGSMHVRMGNYGFSDSIDFCPGHGRGDLRTEITGLQAEAMRSKWRAMARKLREKPADQIDLFPDIQQ